MKQPASPPAGVGAIIPENQRGLPSTAAGLPTREILHR
jgi:hypothetical protein